MKLIIDIPEDLYKWIKDEYDNPNGEVAYSAIENGIPYNPSGDCISRSDLKEKSYTAVILEPDEKGIDYVKGKRYVVDLEDIDNAPTVEPCYQTTSCLDCKNYDKETHNCPRYCEVIKEAIKSRPQGEWAEIEGGYICSNCEDIEAYTPNFCPNCGAKMKGCKE